MSTLTSNPYKSEIHAGLTTFFAAAYIVIVNPLILSEAGIPFAACVTATVLVTFISTLCMGLFANMPILVAPGMGLNTFFTYYLVKSKHIPPETALGIVFWSGILFLFMCALNKKTRLALCVPASIKIGVSSGIGLFIALIGLKNGTLIASHPATMISLRGMDVHSFLFIAGIIVTTFLYIRQIRGAFVLGIIFMLIVLFPIGRIFESAAMLNQGTATWITFNRVIAMPDFSFFFSCRIIDTLDWVYIPLIVSFFFTDFFDSMATFMGLCQEKHLKDEHNNPKNLNTCLWIDAAGTVISGLTCTSPATSFIESGAGIKAGGKGGLTAVVAACCFLPLLFFSPLLSAIPSVATAPILVIVGCLMFNPVRQLDWSHLEEALPAFLGLILIPLTFSITQGITWSVISWVVLKLLLKKHKEVSLPLWGLTVLSLGAIWFH